MDDGYIGNKKIPLKPPDCLKCAYFRVTWDPVFPRACDAFSIKCALLPSQEVYRATKANCPSFVLNAKQKH